MYPQPTQKDKNFSKLYHKIIRNGLWARLSSPAIRVYGVLLTYAHYETGWSYPTIKTITRLSGVNKNLVYRSLRELELTGLIQKRKGKKTFGFRNGYRIIAHPEIYPHLLPIKIDRRRAQVKGEHGRFTASQPTADNECPSSVDNQCPQIVDTDTCPLTVDKK